MKHVLTILILAFHSYSFSADIEEIYKNAWEVIEENPDKAIELAEIQLDLSEKEEEFEGVVKAYYTIGMANYNQKKYAVATTNFMQGLRLIDKKPFKKFVRNRMFFLQSLGMVYYQTYAYDAALWYYDKAYEIALDLDNEKAMSEIVYNFGLISYKIGDYDDAKNNFFTVLKYFKEQDNFLRTAKTLNSIGNCFNKKGELDEALSYYQQAITEINMVPEEKGEYALYVNNLAENSKRRGNYQQAIAYYREALQICDNNNLRPEKAKVLANLADLMLITDKRMQALKYYSSAIQYSDTSVYDKVIDRSVMTLIENRHLLNDLEKDANVVVLASQFSKLSYLVEYLKKMHESYKVRNAALEFERKHDKILISKLWDKLTTFGVLLGAAIVTLIIGMVKYIIFKSDLRRMFNQYDNY